MNGFSEREAQRLLKLESLEVLETPDPELALVPELATQFVGVPAAALVFVDDRFAWFKAAHGVERELRIPREQSVAAIIVDTRAPLQIDDALQDSRYRSYPLAVKGEVRAIAGAPVILSDSTVAGAVLIFDRRPRHFSTEEMERLALVSDVARGLLEEPCTFRRVDGKRSKRFISPSTPRNPGSRSRFSITIEPHRGSSMSTTHSSP